MNATAAHTRRQFLAASTALAAQVFLRAAAAPKLKAAVFGHTGRGDYGHGPQGHRVRRRCLR
ncbi:MAG: hypothetical protein FJ392_06605 [Verrucomicrobia bacterium]|nr:hypothetical protein [Verrucomicrobiota bacterium]